MKFNIAHIATSDNEVNVGMEYAYSEGSFIAIVNVLENNTDDKLIEFKLFVFKSNRDDMPRVSIFTVDTIYHNIAFSGMWMLWDAHRYDKQEFNY